jgi:uncharacterized membrane protein YjjB (DUF3815 family)
VADPRPVPDWMKPLWVRLVFVVLPALWAVFELAYGDQFWALLFGGAAAWGAWTLLVKFDAGPPAGTPPPQA